MGVESLWCRMRGPAWVKIGVVGGPLFFVSGVVGCDRICRGVIAAVEFGECAPPRVVGEGVFEWVVRKGRDVDPNPKVRVRFPAIIVEVAGFRG